MEAPAESATLNGDTSPPAPRNPGMLELVATTAADEDNALVGGLVLPSTARVDAASDRYVDHDRSGGVSSPPPYWQSHERSVSSASDISVSNLRPSAILLEDRSDEDHEIGRTCWARYVNVEDYVVVGGGAIAGAGAYVVWNCTVETLKGAPFIIRKRYSEFDTLRENLVRAYPHSAASIPELPRKSVISRFRPKFLEQRRAGLSHFLNCVLLNPEFSGSPLVKDFVFS